VEIFYAVDRVGRAAALAPAVQLATGMPPQPHRHKVLLVEDDRELRTLLARHLRRSHLEVVEARDAEDALTRLGDAICRCGASQFDAMISDVRMPGVTGMYVAAELRRCDWAMPIVLITAFGSESTHAEAARLGAKLLDKPIDLDELTATVNELLA
jgi:DNA-binding response OmpR family regulator